MISCACSAEVMQNMFHSRRSSSQEEIGGHPEDVFFQLLKGDLGKAATGGQDANPTRGLLSFDIVLVATAPPSVTPQPAVTGATTSDLEQCNFAPAVCPTSGCGRDPRPLKGRSLVLLQESLPCSPSRTCVPPRPWPGVTCPVQAEVTWTDPDKNLGH